MLTTRVPSSAERAFRANARYASRSPRFDPSAMYATSGTASSRHDDFGTREGTRQRDVRFAQCDASALHRIRVEHAFGDGVTHVLEIVQRLAFDHGANGIVDSAIVHELAVGDPGGDVDLEWLRNLT